MRALKVKFKHLNNDFGGVVLAKHLVKTVVKHNYTKIQVNGKVYNLQDCYYFLPKRLGYLPIIGVIGLDDDLYTYNNNNTEW